MNLKKLLSQRRTATVQVALPKSINDSIESYQKAFSNRYPSEGKKRKPDLLIKMMLGGQKAFDFETKKMENEFENYNKSN